MTSDSLLAHLAWRFPGATEDIATEALSYILCKQEGARTALADLLRSGGADPEPMDSFDTQRVYQRSKKPDLVAFSEGREVLLVESKFWASLTSQQPNGYLRLMMKDLPDAKTLLFVAPKARQDELWKELREQAGKEFQVADERAANGVLSATVDSGGHLLMLTSWHTLLRRIEHSGTDVDGNLRQLRGLCTPACDDVPLPSVDATDDSEELSKVDHYKAFLGDAVTLAESRGIIDTKGLSYGGPGYGRFFHFVNAAGERFAGAYAWVGFNFARIESPFFLFFLSTGSDAKLVEVRAPMAGELDRDSHVSIPISARAGYAYVREEVVGKLKEIRDRITVIG
ncbi:MAG: hypothetical protein OXE50_01535 [Chloroflexi bacterium]|nr:hypothetical protein [Chloroflexota bacterium]